MNKEGSEDCEWMRDADGVTRQGKRRRTTAEVDKRKQKEQGRGDHGGMTTGCSMLILGNLFSFSRLSNV